MEKPKVYLHASWDVKHKFYDFYLLPNLSFYIDNQALNLGYKAFGIFFGWLFFKSAVEIEFKFKVKQAGIA